MSIALAIDHALLERQFTHEFDANSKTWDLFFVCWNLFSIVGAFFKLRHSAPWATLKLVVTIAVCVDIAMLYMQLRRYPVFLRWRQECVAVARVLRLGEPPPPAAAQTAHPVLHACTGLPH